MWGSVEQVTLLQKPVPQGERDKLAAPTAVEFLVDMFLMCVHCLDAEMQLLGDLRNRIPVDQLVKDLPLPRGEHAARIIRRLLCGTEHDIHGDCCAFGLR